MHSGTSVLRAIHPRADSPVCPGKRLGEGPGQESPLQPFPDGQDRPLARGMGVS